MGNYVENTVAWMERKGLANKYRHAGIYCIKIDANIVYIGKSANMLRCKFRPVSHTCPLI